MEVIDDEGRQQAKKCRVETLFPDYDWPKAFSLTRLRSLSSETRSFSFKFVHQLLPFNARLSQLLPNNVPTCSLCTGNFLESPLHGCFTVKK